MPGIHAQIGVAVIAGALGGALGGVVVLKTSSHAKPAPAIAAEPSDVRELAARVATLEAELARVEQRPRVASLARAEPRPGAEAPKARTLVDDPVFETAVRDVMDRIQQERASERDERRTQALQRWSDRLGEQAGLSEAQKTASLAIAQDLSDKVRALRDADGGPATPQAWAAQRDALVAQSEQRLGEVLSARQMEVYRGSTELHLDAGLGRRGRGRGGP